MTDSTRAAFEAWESRMGVAESDLSERCSEGAPRAGEYRSSRLQDDWEVWQAARKAALEEAAKVCEDMHDEDRPGDYAYAIRALEKEQP